MSETIGLYSISHVYKYRLIAKFKFHPRVQIVYIRFVGTHAEYDKIKDIQNI